MNDTQLLDSVRKRQKMFEHFFLTKITAKMFDKDARSTRHFKEWLRVPMNYARIMEIPLTYEFLELSNTHSILDISSPKLMSLFLAINGFDKLTISDIEDYFVKDFTIFSRIYNFNATLSVFDATRIPLPDHSFDRIFSISVLEHIPDFGDGEAIKEAARLLKPKGIFVVTLPAYTDYMEEWLKDPNFYWKSKQREDGTIFYQRRYDLKSIYERLDNQELNIEEIIFIAEKPIKKPALNSQGMLLHNSSYYARLPLVRGINGLRRFLPLAKHIPFLPYIGNRYASMHYHYLTRDDQDENIRQVLVKFKKV